MKFSKAQKDILIKGYENAFTSEDLKERFKTDYSSVYEAMVKEILGNNGYPNDVNIEKVNVDLVLYPNDSYESFVTNLEESEKIADIEMFSSLAEDSNFYIEDILDNVGMTKVDLRFKADPSEYLEKYPNVAYFSKIIGQQYDESRLENMLIEDENFMLNVVEPKARDEGFENVTSEQLKYTISDLKLSKDNTTLAEFFINQGVKGEEENVSDFMKTNFYIQIIKNNFYEASIKFESDPNEEEVM